MNLLDSNIVIGGASSAGMALDLKWFEEPYAVSVVTRIEVLGFHRLTPEDKEDLQMFLAGGKELPLDEAVTEAAIRLRQERSMGLGDAINEATALVHSLPLVTRNVDDFKRVAGLSTIDPFVTGA